MTIKICYYTRSNTSKKIAEKLGQALSSPVYEIKDDKDWSGIWGYIKAGYYASTNKPVTITYDSAALEADKIIVLSPLWAGGPASAIRTLLKEQPQITPYMVLTNDGSSLENAFKKTKSLFPRLTNFYGITKKLNNEEKIIQEIVNDLK